MPNRIAIADLGTNTFHLMIVEKGDPFHILLDEKVAVGLGRGGINKGIIVDEAFERALDCMKYFSETISTYDLSQGIAIGTSAMRSAENGILLAKEIEKSSLFKVDIIDGEKEAALIFEGVKASGVLEKKPGLIVDIGGGSVEFIIGNTEQVFWKQSFEIGGIRLMEKFQKHDPILQNEISELHQYLSAQLTPLFTAIKQFAPSYLVGSSGAFDTLTEMELAFQNSSVKLSSLKMFDLPIQSFHRMKSELNDKNRSNRLEIPGMIPLRVDMIVVAVNLIDFLLDQFSLTRIKACTYALKEGAAHQYFR
jgi:exopolyphosphatase/guanosine-5'-triphosphate,3'-diphosphate pyrophosphatase